MKLSLQILKEFLEKDYEITLFRSNVKKLNLERPVFYTGESILKSDTLYISVARDLSGVQKSESGSAVLCIGLPKAEQLKRLKQVISVPEKTELLSLSNRVHDVFERFDQWERNLLSASHDSSPRKIFQNMLDVSSAIFENGLAVMSNSFHMLFQDENNRLYGGYYPIANREEEFSLPTEIISSFKYDKEYQRITKEREIFYYEGDMLPHRVLCKNFFRNDRFLFRFIITECTRSFRATDEILLGFFSEMVEVHLRQLSEETDRDEEGLARLLCESLETGKNNRQAIESELMKKSWKYTDTYRVISFHVSAGDLLISSLNYYAHEIARLFPGAEAFSYRESILVLLNESRIGSLERYSEELSVFVRENNFRVGVSNFSDDLYKIQILYRQAEMALSIGMVEKPMEWIHWFSRYTLQYIYNMLTNSSELGQLYSPIYYQLERYDKENGSNYLETLRTYLLANRNTVRAAKELFIQRSTMIYRLKRIREITENDLEDWDDLLHLYLTFSIIERR